ncbi:LysR family transcriptional regulator [Undibacterium sp. Ji49W]|uniref:LysR family transcriptional regulator n=1 Tax=Undibacterium sp. Ji49W TaxID=3413040 RepID=UPI003BF187CD
MTLKQLEAFYWAATCANFAIAAQRLHLSVSSLSKRIAELEQSLGVPVFDRSGHRATLTDAGHGLLPRALEVIDAVANIRRGFTPNADLVGRCTFGVGELSALTWLPHFVAQVRTFHPRLILEPHVDVGASLEVQVDKGEIDFAVIAGRSSRQTILSQPITQAQFVWMAAPKLVGDGETMVSLLGKGLPIIALPPSAGTTRLVDDWLLAHQIASIERISCNNWGAIAGMLVASVGVGILPTGWADKLVTQKSLCRAPDDSTLTPLPYSFQWRRGDSRPLIDRMRLLVANIANFSTDTHLP